MDIELSDGRCFHIFDLCDIDCPVIFCTAYDQYALEAFNANGIQYLLKPISRNHLFGALERFNRFTTPTNFKDKILVASLNSKTKDRFLVRLGNQLIPLKTNDIDTFIASGKGVDATTKSGRCFNLDYSMQDLDLLLDSRRFFRVNRQSIVSQDVIERLLVEERETILELNCPPHKLVVSRTRTKELKVWLGSRC